MNSFDIASVLLALTALFGYFNYRCLKLPSSIGILAMALTSSVVILVMDFCIPSFQMGTTIRTFLADIDFNSALMHGMLSFLLFAGALHVNINDLLANKWTISLLATIGVIISTSIIGGLSFLLFKVMGSPVPLPVCLVFGALISPTDPIAVLGLLKQLKAPKDLEATIAGESLFNDGVGVVVFLALIAVAGLTGDTAGTHEAAGAGAVTLLFLQEVLGGILLGLILGYLAYLAMKSIDVPELELLITLATVMFMYSLSFWIHVSGPIAVVVTGLFIGNHGKRFAMDKKTREHIDAFWGMLDEILNAVLFLLIGLEVFANKITASGSLIALMIIPLALFARFSAVSVPVLFLKNIRSYHKGIIPILTWGGLRGGISIALVLSLPQFPHKNLLLGCTYAVVIFTVLVQGLSMRRLFARYGIG